MVEFPQDFDLPALLTPVAGDAPSGPDLRQDYGAQSLYYRLRDARAEARAAERAADSADGESETSTALPPQWRTIRDLAAKALLLSKDLEIAAWYTEALLRSDGMVGLNAGVRLMLGLVDGFWDTLYPMPDEDGVSTRVAPVAGLNGQSGEGTLIQPLRKLPLFVTQGGAPIGLWQYQRSSDLTTITDPDRLAQRIAAGTMPFADIENEAHAAGPGYLTPLRLQTAAAAQSWRALSESLDNHAGADSPPTRRVQDLLEQITEICLKYAPGTAVPAEPAANVAPVAAGLPPPVSVAAPGAMTNRDDALRMLMTVADFFRRTEPQSPLAYTLAEAVRRGRMSLPSLLEEIVPDSATRNEILNRLGIKPPPEE